MDTRRKGMMTFSAAAIALMLGLTACGSAVTSQPTKIMDDEVSASANVEMTDDKMSESGNVEMKDDKMSESGNVEMTDDKMSESGNVEMTDDKMKEVAMAVTYEKNFKLMDLAGKTASLEDYAGKKVYVKFWGTWCSICLAGIEDLESFAAEQNAGTDVAVITIVAPGVNGEFNPDDFKDWYEKQGYTFPVLFDEGGKVLQEFGVRAFPTSVIFEKDGKISTNRPGHIDNEDLKKLLNSDQ